MIKDIIIHISAGPHAQLPDTDSQDLTPGHRYPVRRHGWLRQGPRADAWATPKARWASSSSTVRRKRFARGRGARKYREGKQQKGI